MFARALNVALFFVAMSLGCRPGAPIAEPAGADPAPVAERAGPPARAEDESGLADTAERLTADEEEAARLAVTNSGPATASRDIRTRPYPRILLVPEELEALYKAKPQATVRLLLQVVEDGRPWDSIHAVCCIEALVHSPEFGAITAQGEDPEKWDDVIGGANPLTHREHSRRVCIKLIAEKETVKESGGKK